MYKMQVKQETQTGADSRNRSISEWTTPLFAGEPLHIKAHGVAPTDGQETDSSSTESYVDSRTVYVKGQLVMSDGNPVQATSRLHWDGEDWEIYKILSYNRGPSGFGGGTLLIRKVGATNV